MGRKTSGAGARLVMGRVIGKSAGEAGTGGAGCTKPHHPQQGEVVA